MFLKVGATVLVILAAFLLYVALQSPDYMISRTITINGPPEKIFPYLNNSKLAEKWGPWLAEDPEVKMTYSGPDEGVGSRADWTGGKKLGTGSATIVETVANERVGIELKHEKPMQMTQYSEYLLTSTGSQSVVTWQVRGKNTFLGRLMCFFMNMDKMVGGMFEKGLSNLKTLVENPPAETGK